MKFPILLSFVLLSLQGTSHGQSSVMDDGIKALEADKYDVAADLFAKAVAADPQDYAAHFQLALTLSLQNKDQDAVAEYTRTLALKPNLYEAELNLGILLLRDQQASAALPHLQAAVDQKPDQFRPVSYLGQALVSAKQFSDAQRAFEKALAIDPKSAETEYQLGVALQLQGRLDDAKPHYFKAAELQPSYEGAVAELAVKYEEAKRPAEAIEIYKRYPDNPAALERLGVLLFALGKPEEAQVPLDASVAKSPSPANQLALAQVYVALKKPEKAEPLAAKALEASPGDVELRLFYGRLLRDQRKFEPAATQFLKAGQSAPRNVEAWSELAGVLVLLERYPEALGALDKVRNLNAESAGHFFLRGMVLDHLHQPKDAIESYGQFLALSQGKNPNQEFQARQRVKTLELEVKRR
jgi:tetratricopeptide (TPR) repeat protein